MQFEQQQSVNFTLTYLPYQLQPNLPASEELDRQTWLRGLHHQDGEATAAFVHRMAALGAADGIVFESLAAGVVSNTLETHRVLHCLQQLQGRSYEPARFVDSVYASYFEKGHGAGSRDTLILACKESGLSEEEAARIVDGDEGLVETKRLIQEQKMNGVDSVPYVVLEGRKRDFTLVGAKSVEDYVKSLALVVKES